MPSTRAIAEHKLAVLKEEPFWHSGFLEGRCVLQKHLSNVVWTVDPELTDGEDSSMTAHAVHPDLIVDNEESTKDVLISDEPAVVWPVEKGKEGKLLASLRPGSNSYLAVAAVGRCYVEQICEPLTRTQQWCLNSINEWLDDVEPTSSPTSICGHTANGIMASCDGLFFGQALRGRVELHVVAEGHPLLGRAWGITTAKAQKDCLILLHNLNDYRRIGRLPPLALEDSPLRVKKWFFLCVMLHEMTHALFHIYACGCRRCCRGEGPEGHGMAWYRVAGAINMKLQMLMPRPLTAPKGMVFTESGMIPDDLGLDIHDRDVIEALRRRRATGMSTNFHDVVRNIGPPHLQGLILPQKRDAPNYCSCSASRQCEELDVLNSPGAGGDVEMSDDTNDSSVLEATDHIDNFGAIDTSIEMEESQLMEESSSSEESVSASAGNVIWPLSFPGLQRPETDHPANFVYVRKPGIAVWRPSEFLDHENMIPFVLPADRTEIPDARSSLPTMVPPVPLGKEAHLFTKLFPFATPMLGVAVLAEAWISRIGIKEYSSSQAAGEVTIRWWLESPCATTDPLSMFPKYLKSLPVAVDQLFFADLLQDRVTMEVCASVLPHMRGKWGVTSASEILGENGSGKYVNLQVNHIRIADLSTFKAKTTGPEARLRRKHFFLGVLVHEMLHALFNLYACGCQRCSHGYGPSGHGTAWLRVATVLNKKLLEQFPVPAGWDFDHRTMDGDLDLIGLHIGARDQLREQMAELVRQKQERDRKDKENSDMFDAMLDRLEAESPRLFGKKR